MIGGVEGNGAPWWLAASAVALWLLRETWGAILARRKERTETDANVDLLNGLVERVKSLETSQAEVVKQYNEEVRLRMKAGRPITLQTTRDSTAYVGVVALPIVRALQASESEARLSPLELVMPAHNGGDRTFQVRWRRVDGPAIEVEPTRFAVPALDSDLFSITLRLMTV